MRYYQFHIGDYASHTRHLNYTEDLAYRRLLDFYYLHEQPIKQREIARQIGMRDCEQEVLSVLEEFFVSTDVGYINPRADREIEAYKAMKDAGKRGAEKRWGQDKSNTSDAPPIATPCPPHSHPNDTPIATINHEPVTSNKEEAKASLSGTGFPPCPHGQVLELWKQRLPHLSQPRTWEGARQSALKGRWNQAAKKSTWSDGYATQEEGLKWWDSFFTYIANDTKLASGFETSGRVWRPDLPWILNATNFAKIIDGKYQK